MNDLPPSDDPLGTDDLGPDLLAHSRGELPTEQARELDERLAADSALRAEFDRLTSDWETWTSAQAAVAPTPTQATLDSLLASVRDEAAERRAAASATGVDSESVSSGTGSTGTGVSETDGADVVALALGQLEGIERDRVQALVDGDSGLAAAHTAATSLAEATRTALTVAPRPESLRRLMALVAAESISPDQFDTQDLPQPAAPKRGRLHVIRWLAPLAAALAIAAVAIYSPTDPAEGHRDAIVFRGDGVVSSVSRQNNGESVDAGIGAFRFDDDHILTARSGELSVRVVCAPGGVAPEATGALPEGSAEFVLSEGTRLARRDAAHFSLLSGRLRVEANDLTDQLEIRSGTLFVSVTGTRFDVAAVDGRLFVIVEEGAVTLGRDDGPEPRSVTLHAGEQGMADDQRVLKTALDGRSNGDAFLTPVARLEGPSDPVTPNGAFDLVATLAAGEGGAVGIHGFDPSEPRFSIRLKGPGDHSLPVKIQESMLSAPAPDAESGPGSWRLDEDRPYVLRIRLDGLDLEPGMWEARLRYVSYRASAPGSEWLGAVESAPVLLEVRSP